MSSRTVAVIGGGASGTLVCARLLNSAGDSSPHPPVHIEWIGNESAFGPGLAHGTRDPLHLLNVSFHGMSAFAEQPDHFLRWLRQRHPDLGAQPEDFVPRMYYGEYLSQLVPENAPAVTRRTDEAIGIESVGSQYRISLKSGAELNVDEVVLALGALSSLEGQSAFGALRPWQIDAIPAGARVLLIGTSLTMIDTLLSLSAQGKITTVTAVSPRGLLPRAHADHRPHPVSSGFRAFIEGPIPKLSQAIRIFRAECRAADTAGPGWRAVFDEIRPHTATLWSRLSARQKNQFYRHLRRYWDIHRHRIAPAIHEKLRDFQNRRILQVEAARILRIEKPDFRVHFQPRSTRSAYAESFDALVDCTGFSNRVTDIEHPFLKSLIQRGLVALDDPPFGVSENPEHPRVHLIGPLLRASLWETTAILEIRSQAERIATKIAANAAT